MSARSSGSPRLLPVSGRCVVVKQRCCSQFDGTGMALQPMKKEPVSPCHSWARCQTAAGWGGGWRGGGGGGGAGMLPRKGVC